MSRDNKEPNLFDQIMNAFEGYSPSGSVRKDGSRTVFVIQRANAEKSGVADIDGVVATLNSGKLSGGIDEIIVE